MRMLVLTSVRFKTGENEFEGERLVVVNGSRDEDPNVIAERAVDTVKREFPFFYPESELIFVAPNPTFGQYLSKPQRPVKDIGFEYPSFHESSEHPDNAGDGLSEDVLIDTDGWRKKFVVGWYDFDDKKWFTDADAVVIDQKNMKWTRLPLSKD